MRNRVSALSAMGRVPWLCKCFAVQNTGGASGTHQSTVDIRRKVQKQRKATVCLRRAAVLKHPLLPITVLRHR